MCRWYLDLGGWNTFQAWPFLKDTKSIKGNTFFFFLVNVSISILVKAQIFFTLFLGKWTSYQHSMLCELPLNWYDLDNIDRKRELYLTLLVSVGNYHPPDFVI